MAICSLRGAAVPSGKPRKEARLVLAAIFSACSVGAAACDDEPMSYSEMCDASAIVALNATTFVVANDEDDVLRTYTIGHDKPIGKGLDLKPYLKTAVGEEPDIEGAARIGSKIWWITSHGRNSDGDEKRDRHRLFVTTIAADGTLSLDDQAIPYTGLLGELQSAGPIKALKDKLAMGAQLPAEAEHGLNIEGLAASPDGKLLIAFRNPLSDTQQAILIPLSNPEEVSTGKSPVFGPPVFLKLEGRGMRDIAYVESLKAYVIIAGPTGEGTSFSLYRWSGPQTTEVTLVPGVDFAGLSPEAIAPVPAHAGKALVLSDDGDVKIGEKKCKKLKDPSQQVFRARWIPLPAN